MFKKSLTWLLVVLMVVAVALPITAFANEASEAGEETHEHTWVADTNDADSVIEYCTGCTYVKERVTNIVTNIYGSKNGTPSFDENGNLVSAVFDGGNGFKVTIEYATPIEPSATGGYGNFTTEQNRMRLDKNVTVTFTYEYGEFDALYWYFPLGYNATSTSSGAKASQNLYQKVKDKKLLTALSFPDEGATAAFVDGDAALTNKAMGYTKISLSKPVSEISFKTDSNYYYVGNFKIDGVKTYDAGQNHPHTYSDPVVIDPTCVEEGYTAYTCRACGYVNKEDVKASLGGHDWVNGDCFTENYCAVCNEKGGYNHQWATDDIQDNGATEYCENCASYVLQISVGPKDTTAKEVTDESGNFTQYYFENSAKTMRIDVYHVAGSTKPTVNGNSVRILYGNEGVISVSNGTFTTITMFFPGNPSTTTSGGKSAKAAYDEALSGEFINRFVGVDSATTTATKSTSGTTVKMVLDIPVSELMIKSNIDNFYLGTVTVNNIIDVEGEHTHDFQPAKAASCTETVATNFVCAECNFGYAGELAPAGHTAGAEATCVNDQSCTVCNEKLVAALGHSYNAQTTAPDCVNGGYTTYTCANCGDSYKADHTEAAGHNYVDFVCTECGESDPNAVAIIGAKVNVGVNLAIKYLVYLPEGTDLTNVIFKVTNEGHNTFAELEGTLLEGNTYEFIYDNIAPQCMSDLLDAYLIIDGETVASVEDYSIVQNAKNLAAAEDATDELKQFLADLIAYGKAAQEYINSEVVITDEDIAAIGTPSKNAPDASVYTDPAEPTAPEQAYISGAGVRFDSQLQIFVVVTGDAAASATVKVAGFDGEYAVELGNDGYTVYLPGMSMTQISEALDITLYVDGEAIHTITYGVYSYIYKMNANNDVDSAMAELANALYNCAESAKNYLTKE